VFSLSQSRSLGLKVSDEFTVPLCATHHSENHATGDERHWWQERNIEWRRKSRSNHAWPQL